jgi:geranylgeranyl pyrophosphate synthase
VGNDLAQGKQTLPLVHVFEKAEPADRETLLHQLRNGRSMESVMPLIHKYGGLEYAAEKARSWAQKAEEILRTFAPAGTIEHFVAYCRFAVERAY